MATHIALLRAINVGGHRKIAMAELRDWLNELGFGEPRSLLQTGNLVFGGGRRTGAGLERFLEAEAAKRLELRTDFFARTAEEWESLMKGNPFPDAAKKDPSHLVVMFLKDAPSAKSVKELQAAIKGPEVVKAKGRQLYIVYPKGIGRSRLTNALIERKLGTRATGRNWNTVVKLGDLAR